MSSRDYPKVADLCVDICIFDYRADGQMFIPLVKRRNEPFKDQWALPGGFLEAGETCKEAAIRELREETGLLARQLYFVEMKDAIDRDPRGRTISMVYHGYLRDISGQLQAGDDAKEVCWFNALELPKLAFDHDEILRRPINIHFSISKLNKDNHYDQI